MLHLTANVMKRGVLWWSLLRYLGDGIKLVRKRG